MRKLTNMEQCKTGMIVDVILRKMGSPLKRGKGIDSANDVSSKTIRGVIHIHKNNVFLCHNKIAWNGDISPDLHGRKFSWYLGSTKSNCNIPNKFCGSMIIIKDVPHVVQGSLSAAITSSRREITHLEECMTGDVVDMVIPQHPDKILRGIIHVDLQSKDVFVCHNYNFAQGDVSPVKHRRKYSWNIGRLNGTLPNDDCTILVLISSSPDAVAPAVDTKKVLFHDTKTTKSESKSIAIWDGIAYAKDKDGKLYIDDKPLTDIHLEIERCHKLFD